MGLSVFYFDEAKRGFYFGWFVVWIVLEIGVGVEGCVMRGVIRDREGMLSKVESMLN